MNRIIKRVKQLIYRTQYYGISYPFDYLFVRCGLRDYSYSERKKEATYSSLSDNEYISELAKWYHAETGDIIDFKTPVTFTQKIQWYKVFDKNPLKTQLADKYLVRDWVAEKVGSEYLVPLLGVWNTFDEIDFSKLPGKYALKCNHGSGWNIIVNEKNPLNKDLAKKKIDEWMSENFAYKAGFELHYKNIVPKIIAEEYMENFGGDIYDYKFYCFDGRVEYIQFLMDRKKELKMGYYDREWNLQNFVNNHPRIDQNIPRPTNLDRMIELAEKLSEGFPYVRVDLYRLNDGTIKFGEMTFTPASGTQDWNPPEANYLLGNLFHLPVIVMSPSNCQNILT